MKTSPLILNGTEYQAALTVSAALSLMDTYGDIQGAIKALQGQEVASALKDAMEISAILLRGGYDHQRLTGDAGPMPPNAEDLKRLMSPGDLPEVRRTALKTILEGVSRQIEAEADPKNVETTPGD